MFKLIGISLILAVIQISESGPVYQFLPPRDGYVPVYIRLGDTPLDEINPDLALAFHESNIQTRNANDLEEQMVNDAPSNDDLSESVEEAKEKVAIQKDADSDEDHTPETSVKPSNDESESEEKSVPPKNAPAADNKSEEEVNSEEEHAITKLTKENDSDEIVVPFKPTKKSKPEDNSSEEVTKSKRNVSLPSTSAKVEDSSEENDSATEKQQASTSNESKSSEEVDNKS